ncbi:MAG: hypothetical protein JJE41_13665 [Candidatus Heimdallarchaeota archaeon]|nr:hypothetical protein [Candidatus Heimdallarchaeota archaeon]
MDDEQQKGGESIFVKASLLPSSIKVQNITEDDSFISHQEDIGLLLSFDKLQDYQKQATTRGLLFDFLGLVVAVTDSIARNSKKYLKLQLRDIHGKILNLCLFEDANHYCSAQDFLKKNLLKENSLVFIQTLKWDGKYLTANKETLFDCGEHHPQAKIYEQVEDYLMFKLLPKENEILELALGISCYQAEKLVQLVLDFLEKQQIIVSLKSAEISRILIGKMTEIAYAKTYTGMSYLLQGEKQSQVTDEYANYFVGQLQAILDMVVESEVLPLPLSEITLLCILERWRRELVSLHEFEKSQKQGTT